MGRRALPALADAVILALLPRYRYVWRIAARLGCGTGRLTRTIEGMHSRGLVVKRGVNWIRA